MSQTPCSGCGATPVVCMSAMHPHCNVLALNTHALVTVVKTESGGKAVARVMSQDGPGCALQSCRSRLHARFACATHSGINIRGTRILS
jgi:hypothetical protein